MSGVILVDGNGLAWEIATGRRSTGYRTEIFYQMTKELLSVMEKKPGYLPVIVFDSGGSKLRESIYPAYKANRVVSDDRKKVLEGIRIAERAFDLLGKPYLSVHGVEADDLISLLTCRMIEAGQKVVIMSRDSDLWQVAFSGVSFFSNGEFLEPSSLLAEWNGSPSWYLMWKSLVGDPSDNIPGVSGIGPKAAHMLVSLSRGDLRRMFSSQTKRILEDTKGRDGRVAKTALKVFSEKARQQLRLSYSLIRTARDVSDLRELAGDVDAEITRLVNKRRNPTEISDKGWHDFLRSFDAFHLLDEAEKLEWLYAYRRVT